MASQERIELNKRFIRVHDALVEKGMIVKNDRKRSIGAFAAKIFGKPGRGHIINAYLNKNDNRMFKYDYIPELCEHFGVSEEFMRLGVGPMFEDDRESLSLASVFSSGSSSQSGGLPYKGAIQHSTVALNAGVSIDTDEPEILMTFDLPDLKGEKYSFPVQGNSMTPVIEHGDIVICERLENIKDIKDNQIYAISCNGMMWIKYVRPMRDASDNVHFIKLISENSIEHDPFEEEVTAEMEIYKVLKRITNI